MTIQEFFALAETGGTLAILALAVVSLVRGWIIPRREFDALRQERDEWRQIALDATGLADRAVTVAEPRARRQRGG